MPSTETGWARAPDRANAVIWAAFTRTKTVNARTLSPRTPADDDGRRGAPRRPHSLAAPNHAAHHRRRRRWAPRAPAPRRAPPQSPALGATRTRDPAPHD